MNISSLLNDKNLQSRADAFMARHFPYFGRQMKGAIAIFVILAFADWHIGAAAAAAAFLATWRWPSLMGAQ